MWICVNAILVVSHIHACRLRARARDFALRTQKKTKRFLLKSDFQRSVFFLFLLFALPNVSVEYVNILNEINVFAFEHRSEEPCRIYTLRCLCTFEMLPLALFPCANHFFFFFFCVSISHECRVEFLSGTNRKAWPLWSQRRFFFMQSKHIHWHLHFNGGNRPNKRREMFEATKAGIPVLARCSYFAIASLIWIPFTDLSLNSCTKTWGPCHMCRKYL